MKKFLFWFFAVLITIVAALYQRKTGPTYPKRVEAKVNGTSYELNMIRSLALDERSQIKLEINDTSVKAKLFFRRFPSNDDYQKVDFSYRVFNVDSYIMNKIFKIYKDEGFFADIPQQPEAGKIQYYFALTDRNGTKTYLKEVPVVIRFKGSVPAYILLPHILLMFLAMLFSTLAGLMSLWKYPLYKKYSVWTLILFIAGGFVLGPIVQYYAFNELWTGIPFGWDLTDNKTLIALGFWILAVVMNQKKERPLYTALAAFILLLVFSIPHSLFGSELNYENGQVTQGIILNFFLY
jgi:hypothetical protein